MGLGDFGGLELTEFGCVASPEPGSQEVECQARQAQILMGGCLLSFSELNGNIQILQPNAASEAVLPIGPWPGPSSLVLVHSPARVMRLRPGQCLPQRYLLWKAPLTSRPALSLLLLLSLAHGGFA